MGHLTLSTSQVNAFIRCQVKIIKFLYKYLFPVNYCPIFTLLIPARLTTESEFFRSKFNNVNSLIKISLPVRGIGRGVNRKALRVGKH